MSQNPLAEQIRAYRAYKNSINARSQQALNQPESPPGVIGSGLRGLASGATGLAQSVGTGLEYLGAKTGSDLLKRQGQKVSNYWGYERNKYQPQESIQGSILDKPELLLKGSWWSYNLANMAPSLTASIIPGMAVYKGVKTASALGKAITWTPEAVERLARIGGSIAGGVAGGALEGMDTFREIRAKGGSYEDAAAGAEAMTLAAGALNALSFGRITSRMPDGTKKKIVKWITDGATEGLTEYAEEPAEAVIKNMLGYATREEMLEQIKQGVNVIPIAGVMGMGGSIAFGDSGKAQPKPVDDTTTTPEVGAREVVKLMSDEELEQAYKNVDETPEMRAIYGDEIVARVDKLTEKMKRKAAEKEALPPTGNIKAPEEPREPEPVPPPEIVEEHEKEMVAKKEEPVQPKEKPAIQPTEEPVSAKQKEDLVDTKEVVENKVSTKAEEELKAVQKARETRKKAKEVEPGEEIVKEVQEKTPAKETPAKEQKVLEEKPVEPKVWGTKKSNAPYKRKADAVRRANVLRDEGHKVQVEYLGDKKYIIKEILPEKAKPKTKDTKPQIWLTPTTKVPFKTVKATRAQVKKLVKEGKEVEPLQIGDDAWVITEVKTGAEYKAEQIAKDILGGIKEQTKNREEVSGYIRNQEKRKQAVQKLKEKSEAKPVEKKKTVKKAAKKKAPPRGGGAMFSRKKIDIAGDALTNLVRKHGTATVPRGAGIISPDGKFIDFTRGGRMPNLRITHEQALRNASSYGYAGSDIIKKLDELGTVRVRYFKGDNQNKSFLAVSMVKEPNVSQYIAIEKLFENTWNRHDVTVEVYDKKEKKWETVKGIDPGDSGSKVVSSIRAHFRGDTNISPLLDQFHSMAKDQPMDGGISPNELEAFRKEKQKQYGIPIDTINNISELPPWLYGKALREYKKGNIISGVYDATAGGTGGVYLIRSGIKNINHAAEVLSHEMSHSGLRVFFKNNEKELDEFLDWLMKNETYMAEIEKLKEKFDLSNDYEAAEEWLVAHAEHEIKKRTWWQRFVAMMKRALSRIGYTKPTDNDVLSILEIAKNRVRELDLSTQPERHNLWRQRVLRMTTEPQREWYSTLERKMKDLPKKASGEDFRKMLQKLVDKGNLKKEELLWSGLLTLDNTPLNKEKTTRQEILQFIAAEGFTTEDIITEIVKVDDESIANRKEELDEILTELYGERRQLINDLHRVLEEDAGVDYFRARDLATQVIHGTRDNKVYDDVAGYIGNDRIVYYIEKAEELEPSITEVEEEYQYLSDESLRSQDTYEQYTEPGGENYRIVKLKIPAFMQGFVPEYDHFSGEGDIVVYIRINDRIDSEGNKVLFIEELQSDHHQQGRQQGYEGETPPEKFLTQMFTEDTSIYQLMGKDESGEWKNYQDLEEEPKEWAVFRYDTIVGSQTYYTKKDALTQAWYDLDLDERYDRPPNAPYRSTTSWMLLGLKKAIRIAAEEGHDKIAWTDGDMQVKRYPYLTEKAKKGMRKFYNEMLPNVMNAYIRKLGQKGIKSVPDEVEFSDGEYKPVQSIEITPDISQIALMGQAFMYRSQSAPNPAILASKAMFSRINRREADEIMEDAIAQDIENRARGIVKRSVDPVSTQVGKLRETLRRVVKYTMEPISTTLELINPKLKGMIHKHETALNLQMRDDMDRIHPFLDKANKMDHEDSIRLDYAMKNGDAYELSRLFNKYDMFAEYSEYRATMNDLYKRAKEVGFDFGFRENYFARGVRDTEGLMKYLYDSGLKSAISAAIKARETKLNRALTTDEKAYIASSLLRGYKSGQITLSPTGSMKQRQIGVVTPELNKFYFDSLTSIVRYVRETNDAIESRKFFGKHYLDKESMAIPNPVKAYAEVKYKEAENPEEHKRYIEFLESLPPQVLMRELLNFNIGRMVNYMIENKEIEIDQEHVLQGALQARFGYRATPYQLSQFKAIGYLTAMASGFTSAVTQIGDQAYAYYFGGKNAPRAALNALFGKSEVTMRDLGVDNIAKEFETPEGLMKFLAQMFKWTGLEKMDRVGKEATVNATLQKWRKEARTGKLSEDLKSRIDRMQWTEQGKRKLLNELKSGKKTADVIELLSSFLLDIQPIANSELPQGYLNHPNGRVFYMLKTFNLKQLDNFRREAIWKIRNQDSTPQERIDGFKRLIRLAGVFILANATADEIKDLITNRSNAFSNKDWEQIFQERTTDNVLRLFGLSRYHTYNVRREGIGYAMYRLIAPPIDIIDIPLRKDLPRLIKSMSEEGVMETMKSAPYVLTEADSVKMVPVIGRHWYHWFGHGSKKQITYDRSDIYDRVRKYYRTPAGERDPKVIKAIRADVKKHNQMVREKGLEDRYIIKSEGLDRVRQTEMRRIREREEKKRKRLMSSLINSSKPSRPRTLSEAFNT